MYLEDGRSLGFNIPRAGKPDIYVSDPANPVPYRKRPIEPTYNPAGSGWYTWQAQDQRFLDGRKDVLTYRTEPLSKDLTTVGNLRADLFAATSGTDSDWIVKVIDEYPNDGSKLAGYQLPINMEVVRGRFRKSL
ncbi:MAG TPA: CocE/NonD family hydrolase C-terminal non-catalytic domain-containing protein, partial [Fimbriimonas sp.]|nr:CocE/NonD family hydrolase C-terminal non-catalytic domain-containing protein [Fimbriimonas sp.]